MEYANLQSQWHIIVKIYNMMLYHKPNDKTFKI
jgi:hypothetical protein